MVLCMMAGMNERVWCGVGRGKKEGERGRHDAHHGHEFALPLITLFYAEDQ